MKSQKKTVHYVQITIMSHLIVWKASNVLALKFLQVIDGMNVLDVGLRQEKDHIMDLRTHAIMEI